mmetsp:Transcript_154523/g.284751  ORF Transcript_154523/g.284751 Transcript_154523/m.284751 type:complete len:226 (+) Transcript_154523:114-791(+)
MTTLKPALPRDKSELGANRKLHGDSSYYYAHGEGWEVPADAVVRSGPGLVTGGAPTPLGPDGKPIVTEATAEKASADDVRDEVISRLRERIDALERELVQHRAGAQNLTQFSFSDEGAKCKVYVEVGADVLERREAAADGAESASAAEAAVSVTFSGKKAVLRVLSPKLPDGAGVDRWVVTFICESEILPEKCTYRVDRAKGKVSLTLKKKDETKKWHRITTQAS